MSDTLHKIRLLMVVRVVAVTALLTAAFLVELWSQPTRSLTPLYVLTAATYVLTIIYALMYPALKDRAAFIYIQLVGDVVTSSAFVYITGGVSSPFSFLYVPVIIAGGMLLYRRGAFTIAACSCVAYGLLTMLMVYEVLPSYPPGSFTASQAEINRASFSLLAHCLGFTLVAALASTLSESLRRTGEELGETRDDLEDLQAFNSRIIDSVNSGLVTADGAGRITFLNRAAREITGLAENVVRGQPLAAVFSLPPMFMEELRGTLARERRHRFEVDFVVGADVVRCLGFTAGVLRDKGDRPIGYIFTFQDLTEIKALESQVLFRERMSAVGEMAAGMAHELRNPLASVSGSVQVLKGSLPEDGSGSRELLDIIRRESLRLDQVLKDFLDFARPRPFEPRQTDLVALVKELARLLENSRECRPDHRIVLTFGAPVLECEVDVNRMKQVFWNLARNALHAMSEGGCLTIGASPGAPDQAVLTFSDTGRGMTGVEVREFFRPFRSGTDGGTGLGTAIVYRIIEEHHGQVDVNSAPGAGTCVTIRVPTHVNREDGIDGEEPWRTSSQRAS
ncbi:MAG: nitrogen regulation protein NR(II) [Acidobacteriota bacterium]